MYAAERLGHAFVPAFSDVQLEKLVRDIPAIPETLSIAKALVQMQEAKRQLAIVVDELGILSGILTLTDILEQIVGRLLDELDADEGPEVEREGDLITIRGDLSLDRVNRELDWDLHDPGVVTLSGLLVSKLGRLLRRGDVVPLNEGMAEVLEVKANRASLIRLRPSRTPPAPKPEDATAEPDDEPPTSA